MIHERQTSLNFGNSNSGSMHLHIFLVNILKNIPLFPSSIVLYVVLTTNTNTIRRIF